MLVLVSLNSWVHTNNNKQDLSANYCSNKSESNAKQYEKLETLTSLQEKYKHVGGDCTHHYWRTLKSRLTPSSKKESCWEQNKHLSARNMKMKENLKKNIPVLHLRTNDVKYERWNCANNIRTKKKYIFSRTNIPNKL